MNQSQEDDEPISLELYSFGVDFFEKHHLTSTEQLIPFIQDENKFWLNVTTLGNTALLKELAELFAIHHITIEDIQDIDHRPKLDVFDDYLHIIAKMLYANGGLDDLSTEQVSIVMGKNFIITLQETPTDVFDGIRVRLENPQGRMRKLGTDYFTYTLIDAIVEEYFILLEKVDESMEKLEDQIVGSKSRVKLENIYHQRKLIQHIKKNIWPTRELLSAWRKSETNFITKKSTPYINALYQKTVEIIESLEMQRESITTLVEIFMTNISLKQNEVMKTLTIIATIFIPLTFVAGVYGMNFTYMPELEWKYGYLFIWLFFILSAGVMAFYFKKRRWF